MSAHPKLTFAQIHTIRTCAMKDSYYANLYGVTDAAIRNARTALTFKSHPTAPDIVPRTGGSHPSPSARRRAMPDLRAAA